MEQTLAYQQNQLQQQVNIEALKYQAQQFIDVVNKIEIENKAAEKSRDSLEEIIKQLAEQNKNNKEALDIASNAILILRQVSDEAVSKAYGFLEKSLNSALARMFTNTTRKIEIKEFTLKNQYPQLQLILHVGNGKTRSLKTDSGHGLAQIVSLLSVLSLIVITGSRRILVMDEIISGLSVHNRKIVNDILWSFTEIGFQFIVNEHGFIPEGSRVYHLEMNGDVSGVKKSYIAKKGVYLQGNGDEQYDYSEKASTINQDTETTDQDTETINEDTETINEDTVGELIETPSSTPVASEIPVADNVISI